jgi:hypothetical protein
MTKPASCIASVRPLSPITNAVPPDGHCQRRNAAVAIAEVKMCSGDVFSPEARSRCARSPGVYIELFVSTRYFEPAARSRARNSDAPGIALRPWTSTPSMSMR